MKWNSGDVLDGRYRIEKLIGTGGMAHVYRAVDLKARRLVAIKMLKEEVAQNAEFVRRFRSEAEAVLTLNHDNIVRSYDVAESGDLQYIVLEYIEGKTLKQLIRDEGPLPLIRAIPIAVQLCDALAHAHDRLLIHRDVKPQNIIITPKGRVKITDFGIARFADANTMTYMGANILGSVHYVSPEQARGEAVDVSSDLYSVGIVLYEMLTDKLPFDSDNTVSIAIKQIQEPIVPPIELESGIGRAMNEIVLKLTQKDKTLRYQSARELKRDLQRALREPNGQFVTPGKSSEAPKRRARIARTRLGGILNIAVATVILVGLLASMILIVRTVFSGDDEGAPVVPQLLGKTETEAYARCKEQGLELVITARSSRQDVPLGQIFLQEPKAGTETKKGESVRVSISNGPDEVVTPEIVGMLWDEGRSELEALGIQWSLHHELSEQPDGTILNQLPEADTALQTGDVMEIWIAGEADSDEVMPSLINVTLNEAIQQLQTAGFARVLVTYAEGQEGVSGSVVNQLPSGGDRITRSDTPKLWVIKPQNLAFASQDALNVSVDVQDSRVMITSKDGIVETLLYEGKLPAGKQVIPVTVESETPGTRTLLVYVNGVVVREKQVELIATNALQ